MTPRQRTIAKWGTLLVVIRIVGTVTHPSTPADVGRPESIVAGFAVFVVASLSIAISIVRRTVEDHARRRALGSLAATLVLGSVYVYLALNGAGLSASALLASHAAVAAFCLTLFFAAGGEKDEPLPSSPAKQPAP